MRAALAALVLLGGTVGASAQAIAVRDDRGTTVRLAQPPQRIVSLLPSLTESVCALGACARLVGVDRYSNAPPTVNALPKLGGLEDAQIERIVALKPDVVLAATSARAIDRLEALGLMVVSLEPKTHADVRRTLDVLATMLGTPAAGERIWAAIEADLGRAASRIPPALRGQRVYFEVATTPYAAGASSFIGETLTRLGLGNIVPATMGPFPQLNPEYVVRSKPDLVMAVERELRGMPARPGWQALTALREGRVCGFDPAGYDMLSRPGPRMGEAALRIADCLAAWPPQETRR